MSDIYLSLTETPAVVTLSQPVIASSVAATVTVGNTVTVALDANSLSALENVTVTVGAAVSVSNFPASQVVSVSNFPASSSVTIAGFSTSSLPPSTVTVANSVTISNFPSTQTISGTVTANNSVLSNVLEYDGNSYFLRIGGRTAPGRTDYPIGVAGTVTIGNSVTIGSLPAISGTVTVGNFPTKTGGQTGTENGFLAYGYNFVDDEANAIPFTYNGDGNLSVEVGGNVKVGNSVTIGSLPAISGTVTANSTAQKYFSISAVTANRSIIGYSSSGGNQFTEWDGSVDAEIVINGSSWSNANPAPVSVANSVTIGSCVTHGVNVANSVTIGSLPRVTFIDGSGSVTTANTAVTVFASSSTRSYLLVQVTTGSAFVNVGATATTVNGISLTAGQGYAWETTIPQGLVSLISTTTNSAYVAKQA